MNRFMIRGALVAALLFTVAAGSRGNPGQAPLHLDLSRAIPDPYSTVDNVSAIRLWFTEVPAERTASIQLVGPGNATVRTGGIVQDPTNSRAFHAPLGRMLPAGDYTLSWRATGLDGHQASGYFPFEVAGPKPPTLWGMRRVGKAFLTPASSALQGGP